MEHAKLNPNLNSEVDVPIGELIAQYDRMLSVLSHDNWRDVFLFLGERAHQFQTEMDFAKNWEEFIAARALKNYTAEYMMRLPAIVKAAKESLEDQLAESTSIVGEFAPVPDSLGPPEYEAD